MARSGFRETRSHGSYATSGAVQQEPRPGNLPAGEPKDLVKGGRAFRALLSRNTPMAVLEALQMIATFLLLFFAVFLQR